MGQPKLLKEKQSKSFKIGDKVKVIDGVFEGETGEVISMRGFVSESGEIIKAYTLKSKKKKGHIFYGNQLRRK